VRLALSYEGWFATAFDPATFNLESEVEEGFVLKSEVAKRFLHSGTAKNAVPPVGMTK